MIKRVFVAFMVFIPALVGAKGMQCGPFILEAANDGFMHINGMKPQTQKMTFLKQKEDYDNLMMQWIVPRTDYPGFYGMDYVKRNGKAILNVESVRSNMGEPRIVGTYDCKKT